MQENKWYKTKKKIIPKQKKNYYKRKITKEMTAKK